MFAPVGVETIVRIHRKRTIPKADVIEEVQIHMWSDVRALQSFPMSAERLPEAFQPSTLVHLGLQPQGFCATKVIIRHRSSNLQRDRLCLQSGSSKEPACRKSDSFRCAANVYESSWPGDNHIWPTFCRLSNYTTVLLFSPFFHWLTAAVLKVLISDKSAMA